MRPRGACSASLGSASPRTPPKAGPVPATRRSEATPRPRIGCPPPSAAGLIMTVKHHAHGQNELFRPGLLPSRSPPGQEERQVSFPGGEQPSRRPARCRSTSQPGATTTSSKSTARRARAPSTSPPSPSPLPPGSPSPTPRGAVGIRSCVVAPGWVWRKSELLGASRMNCHTSSESRGENLGVRGGIAERALTARARRGYVAHLASSRRS